MSRKTSKSLLLAAIGGAMLAFLLVYSALAIGGDDQAAALKDDLWARKDFTFALQPRFAPHAPLQEKAQLALSSAEPPWNKVVFQSYRDGNWEVYMMDPDGSQQQRITHDAVPDMYPRLHPDLRSILYVVYQDDVHHIYKMNPDGSNPAQVGTPYWNKVFPSWSFDGESIVFSRRKDGHWTIFTMSASGSGERQLTYPGDADDIYPDWSPDGSKIAWFRIRSGGIGDLMIMNSDGSGSRVLYNSLRYPQHLRWSPDGRSLAFDMAPYDDVWNELVVVHLGGGYLDTIYSPPGPLVDIWNGSWSPDGQSILFTMVLYTVQDNKLYLSESWIGRVEIHSLGGRPVMLPGTGMDMLPDWQRGFDTQPPVATIQPLPNVSPSPIQLSWSGVDKGRSGLRSFDLDVQEDGGAWKKWLRDTEKTSGEYNGRGGRRYAFRVRARDNAGNVGVWSANMISTTVESLPPQSDFTHLPRYINYINNIWGGIIRWQGKDFGGSGIEGYDVQYREADEESWNYAERSTTETHMSPYFMHPGHSYFLRLRAVDRAGNEEAWDEIGQGPVIAYRWGISGTVTTNDGVPLPNVMVRSQPQAWLGGKSDTRGRYSLYLSDWSRTYTVTWSSPAFGPLPPAVFPLDYGDVREDVSLPPADDILRDGAFEGEKSSWDRTGSYPPQGTMLSHTGRKAMQLGYSPGLARRIETPHSPYRMSVKRDRLDNLHLLWEDARGCCTDDSTLMYARITPDGDVAEVREIEGNLNSDISRSMSVTPDGHVYILWLSSEMGGYYALIHRTPDGQWSQPQRLDQLSSGNIVAAADDRNILHIFSPGMGKYMQCNPSNVCSPLEQVDMDESVSRCNMTVTPAGAAYFVWTNYFSPGSQAHIYFQIRRPDGEWSRVSRLEPPEEVRDFSRRQIQLEVDSRGVMHFYTSVQVDNSGPQMLYIRLSPDGHQTNHLLSAGRYAFNLDQNDVLHISGALGAVGEVYLYYARVEPDGQMNVGREQSVPFWIAQRAPVGGAYLSTVDSKGRVYFVANGDASFFPLENIYVAVRHLDGRWVFWMPFGHTCWYANLQPIIDSHDNLHVIWAEGSPDCDVFYTSTAAPQTGNSVLSQKVSIPADMGSPTLSFYSLLQHAPEADPRLEVGVQGEDGRTSSVLTLSEGTDGWVHHWLDMSRWRGQTVTLTLNMPQEQGSPASWAFVDDLSLGSGAYPDLWVSALDVVSPEAAHAVSFDILYGNRGMDLAHTARLTYTLPVSASFQSSDPTPAGQSDSRVWWNLGDVPPDQQGVVHVTMNVSPDLRPGNVITGGLRIEARERDIFPDNDAQRVDIFVGGYQVHLPVVLTR